MPTLHFGTKAETLVQLLETLSCARVAPLYWFTYQAWCTDQNAIISAIQKRFPKTLAIVRSSACSEDAHDASHAGEFLSLPNVWTNDPRCLNEAITAVFKSYGDVDPANQIIVQEQLTDIKASGVLFTRDIDTLAPYHVVNYDDTTGSTSSVTSGESGTLKTFIRFRNAPSDTLNNVPKLLLPLFTAVDELEDLFQENAIDIEFAITNDDSLYILQARPIVRAGKNAIADGVFSDALQKVHKKISKLNGKHPGILGTRALYSVMTDWNPAEMIGVRPRALALSLYKELITDSIWAYQRFNYGYRDLRSFPLLFHFSACHS